MFNEDCLMYRFYLSDQLLVHIDHINIICAIDVVNVHTRDKRLLNLNCISKIPKRNEHKTAYLDEMLVSLRKGVFALLG